MSDNGHEFCQAHSGVVTRNTIVISLLATLIGLIITVGGYQLKLLTDLRVQVAISTNNFADVSESIKEIKADLKSVEMRVGDLEGGVK